MDCAGAVLHAGLHSSQLKAAFGVLPPPNATHLVKGKKYCTVAIDLGIPRRHHLSAIRCLMSGLWR